MNSNSNKSRLVLISVTPAILIWFSTGLMADIGDDTAAMSIRRGPQAHCDDPPGRRSGGADRLETRPD